MSGEPLPFLDFGPAVAELRPALDAAYGRVMDGGWFLLGGELGRFEGGFADFCGAPHCAGVASGFHALELILRAWGIGSGDEVIVPGNTCIPTWLSVSQVGATPVPVDPDLYARTIDPACVVEAITPRTRALIAVHLYGQACDMRALREVADEHGLRLIVDAAQSAGASIEGSRSAALGDAAAFSFYPTKNLGAFGDAGAVVTADEALADKVRLLRNYGMADRLHHPLRGENARMEELQAAFLTEKLAFLECWNDRRCELAGRYRSALSGMPGIGLVEVPAWAEPVWHLFTVLLDERDSVRARMSAAGIGTDIHYPVPPHLTPAYADLGLGRGSLPVTEQLADGILSLPLHPHLSDADVDRVAESLCEAVDAERAN